MKIRSGLVLMMAFGLGMGGWLQVELRPLASRKPGLEGWPAGVPGGEAVNQGYSPRNTENTRMARLFRKCCREDEAEAARPIYEQALGASACKP
ncbi:MAG: hypothetical protein CM1200mP14_18870 [Gammaproteobacteria bacterium]|nr:MAG: hypothetical protein CM1200mP14_18870 [Gammaproteobacteria bacterium]